MFHALPKNFQTHAMHIGWKALSMRLCMKKDPVLKSCACTEYSNYPALLCNEYSNQPAFLYSEYMYSISMHFCTLILISMHFCTNWEIFTLCFLYASESIDPKWKTSQRCRIGCSESFPFEHEIRSIFMQHCPYNYTSYHISIRRNKQINTSPSYSKFSILILKQQMNFHCTKLEDQI